MSTSDPAVLRTPVLLAPRVLDGPLAERLLERGAERSRVVTAPIPARVGPGTETAPPMTAPEGAGRPAIARPAEGSAGGIPAAGDGLSEGERAMLDALRARDREVRAHEEAHARVGGRHAGEPSYTYQQGPDGGRYAVGGSVAIDTAPVQGDPAATIAKMAVVRAAALAPAEPSASDRRIAAIAEAETRLAIAELARRDRETAGAGPAATAAPVARTGAEERAFDAAAERFLETLGALFDAVDPGAALDRTA